MKTLMVFFANIYPKVSTCLNTSVDDLKKIQRSLNARPRKTFGYMMPVEKLGELVALSS